MKNPAKFVDDDNLKTVLKEVKGIGTVYKSKYYRKISKGSNDGKKKKIIYPTEFEYL